MQNILNHNYSDPGVKRAFRVYARARDVAILESFAGEVFQMKVDGEWTNDVVGTAMARSMADKYAYLKESTVINLVAQSLFGKAVYDADTGKMDRAALYSALENELTSGTDPERKQAAGNLLAAAVNRDHLSVFEHIDASVLADAGVQALLAANGVVLSVDGEGNVSGSFGGKRYLGDGNDNVSASGEIFGRGGNDTIRGGNGDDAIYGGDGNDTLYGGSGNDMLFGGAGDDMLVTGSNPNDDGYGHDILEGGRGDDFLTGSRRSSTYVYGYGDGDDTIADLGQVGNTPDVLQLNGLRSDEFRLEKSGSDLKLVFRNLYGAEDDYSNGSILIKNAFGKGKIERFEFEDRTLDLDQVLDIGQWSTGWFPKQEETGRSYINK